MKRIISLFLAVGIILSGAVAVSAGVPDPGPGRTNIYLQNIGANDATVSLVFTTGEVGGQAWQTDTGSVIKPKAVRSILYPNFAGQITDGWAGAVEVSATEPMAAIVNMFWDSPSGAKTAATYTGVSEPATSVYLPNLLVVDQRQTRITVQNTEDAVASITMYFYNRDGAAVGNKGDTIPAKSEKTYYLDQVPEANFSATKGTGSARITANKKIAAVASIHYPAYSEAYSAVSDGDTTLWVPGVFRKQMGAAWQNYNATVVQNLGSQAANVTVYFLNENNTVAHTMSGISIPANASIGINMITAGTLDPAKYNAMASDLGTMWSGTIKFVCSNGQKLAGVSFYFPFSTGVTDILAYNAIRDTDAASKALSFPAVYRKMTGGGDEQWTTTLVQNVSNTGGTVAVEFFNVAGNKVGDTVTLPIVANGMVRLNLKAGGNLNDAIRTTLNGFVGGIYITPSAGVRIIGVNDIFFSGSGRASGYAGFSVP